METGNPTADSGASTLERLESYLASDEPAEAAEQPEQSSAPEEAPNTDEPDSDVQAETDEPQLSTSDLAKYMGVDESMFDLDDDGNVIVKTKIDGKEGAAKFSELVKNYQLQGHIDNKAREVAEQQRLIQQRMAEVDQAAQSRLQHIESLSQVAQQELMREFQSIDWQTLRAIDPGEYAAKQADFQQRGNQIQSVLQQAQMQREQSQYQQQAQFNQFLERQRQILPQILPEWADQDVATKEKAEIKQWGIRSGLDPQFLESVSSAALVKALRNAMLYEKGQSTNAETEKRVRSAPKLVRPGQSVDAKSKASESIRGLKSEIKKSGGKTGIAEYLLATGKV